MSRHLHPTILPYCRNPRLAREYDRHFAYNPLFAYDLEFMDRHLDRLPPPVPGAPPRAALDLGCGTGRHLLALAQRGWKAVGVDLNPHMLDEAEAKLRAHHFDVRRLAPAAGAIPLDLEIARVHLVAADFHQLHWPSRQRFSAVLLMFSTLGLVRPADRRRALLARLRRDLAPDALLLLHAHNVGRLQPPPPFASRLRGLLARRPASGSDAIPPPNDNPLDGPDALVPFEPGDQIMAGYRGEVDLFLHLFSRDELARLVEDAGYDIVELQPLAPGRDRPYQGDRPDEESAGFLLCARPAQPPPIA